MGIFLFSGTYIVSGPDFSTILLISLVLANVPLAIISSLPLLAPYVLKSFFSTPFAIRYLAAGELFEIFPAGEI
jgi:hypothetical protein